jgi:hypothetical protein
MGNVTFLMRTDAGVFYCGRRGDLPARLQRRGTASRVLRPGSCPSGSVRAGGRTCKTKRLRFRRFAQQHCHEDGLDRPETFTFLGFTHYVRTSRTGHFVVDRRLDTKRMRPKLFEFKERLKSLRPKGGRAMTDYLRLRLLGNQQHWGASGNSVPLRPTPARRTR